MRSFLLITLVLMAMGAARAQSAPSALLRDCVPPREMPEVVVRANLCWNDKSLVYVIVALRKDGRVVHVMIDGPSGRVRSVQ